MVLGQSLSWAKRFAGEDKRVQGKGRQLEGMAVFEEILHKEMSPFNFNYICHCGKSCS